jgi:hypothetical protein
MLTESTKSNRDRRLKQEEEELELERKSEELSAAQFFYCSSIVPIGSLAALANSEYSGWRVAGRGAGGGGEGTTASSRT